MGRLAKDTTIFFVQRYHMSHIKNGWDLCKNPLFKPFFSIAPYYLMPYGTIGTNGTYGIYEPSDCAVNERSALNSCACAIHYAVNSCCAATIHSCITAFRYWKRLRHYQPSPTGMNCPSDMNWLCRELPEAWIERVALIKTPHSKFHTKKAFL